MLLNILNTGECRFEHDVSSLVILKRLILYEFGISLLGSCCKRYLKSQPSPNLRWLKFRVSYSMIV